ncbi:putative T7SS-secreted protein [Saccharopolyspora hattusasensis]|uniref:putative T7SS-secreted protein n=1 Tax=Saccharopolyspora hattusasensis TaxID=1128679 RepID=UPI003D987FC0
MATAELGETTNPRLLVPGNPEILQRSADTLTRIGNALVQAGEGLRKLDTGGWHGPAADAFHEYFDGEPARWLASGDAMHQAARALTDYIAVFGWAQREAEQAAFVWEHGKKLSEDAYAKYRGDVARAEAQARQTGSAPPSLPWNDPGQALRDAANDQRNRARQQLKEAGDRAQALVAAARDQAPAAPNLFEQVASFAGEFGKGVGAAATEAASFIGTISPTRLITDPAQYGRDMAALGDGVKAAATNPVAFAKAAVDWDTWSRNPGRALGKLGFDGLLTAGSIGAGAAVRSVRAGKAAERTAEAVDHGPPASSATSGRDLAIGLAKESQMSEKGVAMAGAGTNTPLRDAPRLAAEHGGQPEEWIKKSSTSYTDKEGRTFETHWYEHGPTGNRVEFKHKFPNE